MILLFTISSFLNSLFLVIDTTSQSYIEDLSNECVSIKNEPTHTFSKHPNTNQLCDKIEKINKNKDNKIINYKTLLLIYLLKQLFQNL